MYGVASEVDELEWPWVLAELAAAGTYWVVARSPRHPHPRPVWGVWFGEALHVSIGSPVLARQLATDPAVTVHLDSGTDVVVVEGAVSAPSDDAPLIAAYDAKYDWHYDVGEYGPLTTIRPAVVLAWRSAGWAGRDGFRGAGRWRFDAVDGGSE